MNRRINFGLGLGNCGFEDNNNSLVLAIGKGLYDRNGGNNCNQVTFIQPFLLHSSLIFFYSGSVLSTAAMAIQHMG